jgi:hypothetical protein
MKNKNAYTSREEWLRAATDELRPYFAKLGYTLPEKIRFAIAFTSTGKRGAVPGECWLPASSADQHFEIIIRADIDNPVEVLAVLVHELVHSLLPIEAKHGKEFREIARRVGLEGKIRHTTPTPILAEKLQTIVDNLGALPHAKLDFAGSVDAPRKQAKKWLKAECKTCGYSFRITSKWALCGMPNCMANAKHGNLVCQMPEDSDDNEAENIEASALN